MTDLYNEPYVIVIRVGGGEGGSCASKTNNILGGENKLISLTEGFTSACSLRTFPCAG